MFFFFLNCVHELILYQQLKFEITEALLLFLMNASTTTKFDTFIFPNEKTRLDPKYSSVSAPVWRSTTPLHLISVALPSQRKSTKLT
jgi:hypothetical protein